MGLAHSRACIDQGTGHVHPKTAFDHIDKALDRSRRHSIIPAHQRMRKPFRGRSCHRNSFVGTHIHRFGMIGQFDTDDIRCDDRQQPDALDFEHLLLSERD